MMKPDELAQEQALRIFIKLLGLEELTSTVGNFYQRLPKALIFKTPTLSRLIDTSFYRITYAIINPKISGPLKEMLPVELDLGGYFFPTPEIEKIRKKLVDSNYSPIDRNQVLTALKLILDRGLKTFKELPLYRYLAVTFDDSNKTGSLSQETQAIAETFSLLARRSKSQQAPVKSKGKKEIIENLNLYESSILPTMQAAGLLLYALYFDLTNLFLGKFTNDSIKDAIDEEFSGLFDQESPLSLFIALMSPIIYSLFKQEKIKYLESRNPEIVDRLYIPLALWAYREGLASGRDVGGKGINKLKTQEFLDYNSLKEHRGYVECVRRNKDIISLLDSAISLIREKTGSFEAVDEYLKIFHLAKNRNKPYFEKFIAKVFLELWALAWIKGYSAELFSGLDNLIDVLDDQAIVEVLMEQDSGKLVLMLGDQGLKRHLNKVDNLKADFESLYKIFSRDKAIFEQVYSYAFTIDELFVQVLAKLLDSADHNASNIIITGKIRKFVRTLKDYGPKNAQEIILVLENFSKAQRLISYGYAPFSGNLEDLEEKEDFSIWFFRNKEKMLKKLILVDEVSQYLYGSTDSELREALVKLLEKQGDEFFSKHLRGLRILENNQHLEEQAYLRMVNIFTPLSYAKRLCRKREIIKVLQSMASLVPGSEWAKFSKKFIQINANELSAYEQLFKDHNATLIMKIMDKKADIREKKILTKTYTESNKIKQKPLVVSLIDSLGETGASCGLIEVICSRIRDKDQRIAEFAINELKKGKFPEEIFKIISMYKNDEEFRKVPPDNL